MSGGDGRGRRDDGVSVRTARGDEVGAIRRLLDAAMLTVPDDLADHVAAGDALVAVAGGDGAAADGPGGVDDDADVVGALVLDGGHVDSIAVGKPRRADGVGTALVAAAAERTDGALTATFRPQVRPFYESLGFEVADRDGRLFGTLGGDPEDADDPEDSGPGDATRT